eukprot:jgi/Botrbrau1/14507/Bobra.0350s0012.1
MVASAMAHCGINHVTLAILICLSAAFKVAADSALYQPDPTPTNPVAGLEAIPETTLTQQVEAIHSVDIQKLATYLHEALPSLHDPVNPVPEAPLTTTNPMESQIPTDPAIPERSTDITNSITSVGELTPNLPADALEQATATITKNNPVDDMLFGPGSIPLSPTPQVPVHNPLDDFKDIKAIHFPEKPVEANLDDFCSKKSFTADEAEAHAARLRAVRGTKRLGFQGAPYVPLAPWSCDGKDPDTVENVKRIPIPSKGIGKKKLHANLTEQRTIPEYGIQYWGGPVTNPLRFYYIWYGNWPVGNKSPSDKTTVKILEDLAQSLGNSCIWSTTTTYTNGNGVPIISALNFAGSIFVPKGSACYQGLNFDDSTVTVIADCLVRKGLVVNSPNTQYLVLGSRNINYFEFCLIWCGWHDYDAGYITGYVQSAVNCNGCSIQSSSPNSNSEADAMASIVFHELTETATDPHINAWQDENEHENADKCAWNYGTKYDTPFPGGGKYNTRTTCPASAPNCVSRYWLLQQNWHNVPPFGECGIGIYPNCNSMG